MINNGGIIKRTPIVEEIKDFELVIKVDMVNPFIISKHGGKIIIPKNLTYP